MKRLTKIIPPIMPRNELRLESCRVIDNFLLPRILGSELISFSAAFIATFATFPLIVLNEKIAPTFTTSGFKASSENTPIKRMKVDSSKTRFMVILNDISDQ